MICAALHQWDFESGSGASDRDCDHGDRGRGRGLGPFYHHLCDFFLKSAGCLLELVSESL